MTTESFTRNDINLPLIHRLAIKSSTLHYLLQRVEHHIIDFQQIVSQVGETGAFQELKKLISTLNAECRHSEENMETVQQWFDERINPILKESEICRHSCNKPPGYDVDFNVIELIWQGHTLPQDGRYSGTTVRGQLLNAYVLNTDYCLAIVEQLIHFQKILNTFTGHTVASIGCKSAIEMYEALRMGRNTDLEVHLYGQSEKAIQVARSRLISYPVELHCYSGSIIQNFLMNTKQHYDLIYSPSILNYFSVFSARRVIELLWSKLNPGGVLAIANAHTENPHRIWIECVGHLYLNYKSEDEMHSLVRGLSYLDYVKFMKDSYNVYQYFMLRKQPINTAP